MQLTLQIEMLTKTVFPVVCDSCNMSRYVYLFPNRKPRKNQGIQLEPNHEFFEWNKIKVTFRLCSLLARNFEGRWYNLRNLWYYYIITKNEMYRMNGRYGDLATVGKITTKDKENGRIMRQYMSRTWINQTYMLYNCIVWNISINWHSYLVNHIVTWKLKICKWNKIHSWWKNNKL